MAWKDLNMKEKAAFISIAILNGLMDREEIVDAYNRFDDGGHKPNILGIEVPQWAETAATFVPFLGSAMDIKEAWENPTAWSVGNAIVSTGLDFLGASLAKGLYKTYKVSKAASKSIKAAEEAVERADETVDTLRKFYKNYTPPTIESKVGMAKNMNTARQLALHARWELNNLQRQAALFDYRYPRLAIQCKLFPFTALGNSFNIADIAKLSEE